MYHITFQIYFQTDKESLPYFSLISVHLCDVDCFAQEDQQWIAFSLTNWSLSFHRWTQMYIFPQVKQLPRDQWHYIYCMVIHVKINISAIPSSDVKSIDIHTCSVLENREKKIQSVQFMHLTLRHLSFINPAKSLIFLYNQGKKVSLKDIQGRAYLPKQWDFHR